MFNQATIFRSPAPQQDFASTNPVDFELLDDEGRQQIYILNDQSPGRTHHLVLANESGQDLVFQKDVGRRLPSRANHHFELRFRPGTLGPEYLSWLTVGTGGWRLATEERFDGSDDIPDGTVSLYLLFVGEEELVLPAGRTVMVILNHVKAGIPGGSRGSRMELRYQTDGQVLLPAPSDELRCYRQERLQIINNRGKKDLPMIAAFEGSSTVLNDGETDNHLVLQISNFLHNQTIALNSRDSESPTKFILSFDTSTEQAAWALCNPDEAQAITPEMHFEGLDGTSWSIRKEVQGNTPQWVITLLDEVEVEVGQYFHLHIEGLITAMPSGFTTLYLLYENIPGFWDGRFEIPIEKSPLKFDDQKQDEDHREDGHFIKKTKVGIGNTTPEETLDVNGGIRGETMVLRNGIVMEKKTVDGKEVEVEKQEGPHKNPALEVKGNTLTRGLDSTGKINAAGAKFTKPSNENLALETTGDAKIEGKITANELEISGKLTTEGSASKSLDLSDSLTVGSVKVTGGNGNLQVAGRLKDSTGFVVPPGGIIMWSGASVPEGWKLCNGSNGTPDLRGRFIVGYHSGDRDYDQPGNLSGGGTTKGKTGGEKFVRLTEGQMPEHNHDTKAGNYLHNLLLTNDTPEDSENILPDGGLGQKRGTRKRADLFYIAGISPRGNNESHENRPPYYVLAFIMKK